MASKKKQKFRMTIAYQVVYEADVDAYDTKDVKEMASVDEAAAAENPALAVRALSSQVSGGRFKVKCVPEPEKESPL